MGVETLPRATLTSIFILAISFTTLGQAPSVIKIDPPSWWANHSINPIRVLIRGKNLSGARVRSENSALRVSALKQNSSYLFIDLQVSSVAKPGKYSLVLETQIGKTTIPFSIEASLDSYKNFQVIKNDDVIYL